MIYTVIIVSAPIDYFMKYVNNEFSENDPFYIITFVICFLW